MNLTPMCHTLEKHRVPNQSEWLWYGIFRFWDWTNVVQLFSLIKSFNVMIVRYFIAHVIGSPSSPSKLQCEG